MAKKSNSHKNWFLPRHRLEELLSHLAIDMVSDTSTDLIGYCPFHMNRDSPAFNISLRGPHLWKCHNAKCGKHGNVITLIVQKGYTYGEAEKMLLHGGMDISDVERIVESFLKEDDKKPNPWAGINSAVFQEKDTGIAKTYFEGRGIGEPAYLYFELGYSGPKDMVVIPIHNEHGVFSGIIGREWRTKRYEYSEGLARRNTIYNIHHAKRFDSIILTEGALDSIYVWQSGHTNVGSILGSAISPPQYRLLRKYFEEVICFFDNDEAGNAARDMVMDELRDLTVTYVTYPQKEKVPKDPGDLSVDEINEMILTRRNRIDMILDNQSV